MKVAMITDTHHGVRNDAPEFLDMTEKFTSRIFIPEIKARGIRHVVHLGDILDRRKYVNFSTSYRLWHNFLGPILDSVDRFDLILGNHDEYLKNTSEVSGPMELFRHLRSDKFALYDEPTDTAWIDGTEVLYLPWINDDNHDESMSMIRNTRAKICLGHLEVETFDMYPGMPCEHGLSPSLFDKFDVTASGHFHTKSSKSDFHYLGSHGQFTWGDYNDARGFHVFDTETREFEFIHNPYTMFEKVHYNDSVEAMLPVLIPDLEGKHVKVVVHNRKDQGSFESFIEAVEAKNPSHVQVVDDHLNADVVLESDDIGEDDDTMSILRKVIDGYEGNKDMVESLFLELYQEALSTS